jgi:hypothetical protein
MKRKKQPEPAGMQTRSLTLRLSSDGAPLTLDIESRSLDVIAATENRVRVFDYERWEPIDEVLLVSGAKLPGNRQVPLLDTHSRYSVAEVIGSCRNLRTEAAELVGRIHFANTPETESAWAKTRDGHLTDVSVGYAINKAVWIPDGESAVVDGRSFEGPLRVVTEWTLKELSLCPIGADAAAKARAEIETAGATSGEKPKAGDPAPNNKDSAMDKRMLAFLVSRGLPNDATEEQAWDFLRTLPAEQNAPDVSGEISRAISAERERFSEIHAMGVRFDIGSQAAEMIRDGLSVDQARAKVLEIVAEKQAAQPQPGFRVAQVGADERDKFRTAAEDGLLLRSGKTVDKPADGASDLAGYSLRELARHSLLLANQPTGGDVMGMLGRAMTTSDLPGILANVANKSLLAGYETAGETWQVWCDTGSVPDFKTNTLASIGEFSDLDEVPESTEYKYGERVDARETFNLVTYGKLFAITRQTLINDDLGALTDTPMMMGEAAARRVGDLPYAVLTANGNMRDGVALFNAAAHGNVGTQGLIGATTLAEAIFLMKLQQDLSGLRRLNIRPEYVIAPVRAEGAAEIFFNSTVFSDGLANTTAVGSTRTNVYGGTRFTRVYDARLDGAAGNQTAWYVAGPKGKTVRVVFLNGQQTPFMESRQGWNVDGVEFKVRIDAAAKAVDWKALLSNAG